MVKLLWVDTETTGLNPEIHGVIDIACLYEVGVKGRILDTFQTLNYSEGIVITKEALKINGFKEKKIKKHPKALPKFIKFLDSKVVKKDWDDRLMVLGYNVKFDLEMIHGWANIEGYKDMAQYLDWRVVDVMSLVMDYYINGGFKTKPKDFKLTTICKILNIPIDSHKAMSDIKATRDLYYKLKDS